MQPWSSCTPQELSSRENDHSPKEKQAQRDDCRAPLRRDGLHASIVRQAHLQPEFYIRWKSSLKAVVQQQDILARVRYKHMKVIRFLKPRHEQRLNRSSPVKALSLRTAQHDSLDS